MGKFTLGQKRPLIIAGPCSAETREQTLETALRLARSRHIRRYRRDWTRLA